MKKLYTLLFFSILFSIASLFAQQNADDCTDIVRLDNGSELRGKITEYAPDGNLVIVTWSGVAMTVPAVNVKNIKQRCKDGDKSAKPYDFKERGLYNATRFGTLAGQTYVGDNTVGFTLYHSVGWMFRRSIGAGVGVGAETYSPSSGEPATYPIFVEMRGYLLSKRVAPFYTIGGGWAFAGKNSNEQWGSTDSWKGGWIAKMQIGYRLGNYFTLHGGISLQKKTRTWNSVWGGEWGTDRILHKRLELGIGIIL